MNGSHRKEASQDFGRRTLSKFGIIAIAVAAVIVCCFVLLTVLPGCGGDMLATTTQAQGSSQAASAEASGGATPSAASSTAAPDDAIEVTVEIDCANAHAYNAKFPESLGTFSVSLPKDGTVFDALVATGVKYAMRGRDYVSSIGGIEEKVCGRDSGWLYLVDGKRPLKNSTEYQLSGGEVVEWVYTVTEGDVSWENSD